MWWGRQGKAGGGDGRIGLVCTAAEGRQGGLLVGWPCKACDGDGLALVRPARWVSSRAFGRCEEQGRACGSRQGMLWDDRTGMLEETV